MITKNVARIAHFNPSIQLLQHATQITSPNLRELHRRFWTRRVTEFRVARQLISENKDHLDICPVSPCLISPSVFITNSEKLMHLRPDSAAGNFASVMTLTSDKCNYKSRCWITRLRDYETYPRNDNSCGLEDEACYCPQAVTKHVGNKRKLDKKNDS